MVCGLSTLDVSTYCSSSELLLHEAGKMFTDS